MDCEHMQPVVTCGMAELSICDTSCHYVKASPVLIAQHLDTARHAATSMHSRPWLYHLLLDYYSTMWYHVRLQQEELESIKAELEEKNKQLERERKDVEKKKAAARREAAAAYAVELAAREAKLKDVFDKLKEDPR
eukprot:15519-Heterococcus_DN1.PRE.1